MTVDAGQEERGRTDLPPDDVPVRIPENAGDVPRLSAARIVTARLSGISLRGLRALRGANRENRSCLRPAPDRSFTTKFTKSPARPSAATKEGLTQSHQGTKKSGLNTFRPSWFCGSV